MKINSIEEIALTWTRSQRNRIMCRKCDDIIESEHRHDFKSFPCGSCSVDGGYDYLRRSGNCEDWKEISVIQKDIET